MKTRVWNVIWSVILILSLLLPTAAAQAQSDSPGVEALASKPSKPDQYGYTWRIIPYAWIDATGGTDLGLGDKNTPDTRSESLPFPVKYYEDTFSSITISRYGYFTFKDQYYYWRQGLLPNPELPNGVVAPFWSPMEADPTGPAARVYVTTGGDAPNRYVVIEWYQMKGADPYPTDQFTFEAIIHENGSIDFQYETMTFGKRINCGTAGIENGTGLDGLRYVKMCGRPLSGKAVSFSRPAPAARLALDALYKGGFAAPGGAASLPVTIRNTGELGVDTFDLRTGRSKWAVSYYAADGVTPLIDTNGNGLVDTGPVEQDASLTVVVKLAPPATAVTGNAVKLDLTARSALNPKKTGKVTLQAAIPTSFSQTLVKTDDDEGVKLHLVSPEGQQSVSLGSDALNTRDPAVLHLADGRLISVWSAVRCVAGLCPPGVWELRYSLVAHDGTVLRAGQPLIDLGGATTTIEDVSPALAQTADGHVAIFFSHSIVAGGGRNMNLYLAILDPDAPAETPFVLQPTNITNNDLYLGPTAPNAPLFYSPRVAVTRDGHIGLAWRQRVNSEAGPTDDIYLGIRNADGSELTAAAPYTQDTAGYDVEFNKPSLTAVVDDQNRDCFLLAWSQVAHRSVVSALAVDSSGVLVKAKTDIKSPGAGVDAAQLPDGRIVMAWTVWARPAPQVIYVVLKPNFRPLSRTLRLTNLSSLLGNAAVSVSPDPLGNAVITWMDVRIGARGQLYYGVVNNRGKIITPAMVFLTADPGREIFTNYETYGNSTY